MKLYPQEAKKLKLKKKLKLIEHKTLKPQYQTAKVQQYSIREFSAWKAYAWKAEAQKVQTSLVIKLKLKKHIKRWKPKLQKIKLKKFKLKKLKLRTLMLTSSRWKSLRLEAQAEEVQARVSSKQTKNISVRTKTNRNKICFGCVSVCFVKPEEKKFRFVLVCFGVSNLYWNNWNKQNCFKTNRNNPKFSEKYQICSLSNCFGWSFVCFGSIETLKSLFRYRTETNYFETNQSKPKQTEINRNNPKFFEKQNKICSLSHCFGCFSVCFGSIETPKFSVLV